MRLDDLPAPSGKFVARVSAPPVITTDRRPGRGTIFPAVDTVFVSVLPYFPRAAWASQKPPLLLQMSPCLLLPKQAVHGEPTPSLIRPCLPLRRLAFRRPRLPWHCCPPAVFPLGRVDGQPQLQAQRQLPVTMASDPAGPLVHLLGESTPRCQPHGRDRLWPSFRPLLLLSRLARRYPFRPTATAPSLVRTRLLISPPPPGTPSVATTDFHALGASLRTSVW